MNVNFKIFFFLCCLFVKFYIWDEVAFPIRLDVLHIYLLMVWPHHVCLNVLQTQLIQFLLSI